MLYITLTIYRLVSSVAVNRWHNGGRPMIWGYKSPYGISRIIVWEGCITSPSIFTYAPILRRGREVAFLSAWDSSFERLDVKCWEIGCSCREIEALVLRDLFVGISRIIVLEWCITSPSIFTYGLILRRGARLPFLSAWVSSFERFVCLNLSDYCFGMMYNIPVHLYLRSNLTAGRPVAIFIRLGFFFREIDALVLRDWM